MDDPQDARLSDEELDSYFRCVPDPSGWELQVGVVRWDGPQTPEIEWRTYRRWQREPSERQLHLARASALAQPRFFRVCSRCGQTTNTGHMHDSRICQSCAEKWLGIVH